MEKFSILHPMLNAIFFFYSANDVEILKLQISREYDVLINKKKNIRETCKKFIKQSSFVLCVHILQISNKLQKYSVACVNEKQPVII